MVTPKVQQCGSTLLASRGAPGLLTLALPGAMQPPSGRGCFRTPWRELRCKRGPWVAPSGNQCGLIETEMGVSRRIASGPQNAQKDTEPGSENGQGPRQGDQSPPAPPAGTWTRPGCWGTLASGHACHHSRADCECHVLLQVAVTDYVTHAQQMAGAEGTCGAGPEDLFVC